MSCLSRILCHGCNLTDSKFFTIFRRITSCELSHRTLYTLSSLGIDGHIEKRERVKRHLNEEKFRKEMQNLLVNETTSLISSGHLWNMLHLTGPNDEDLQLLEGMMRKYLKQCGRTGFALAPTVMRCLHHINRPDVALKLFKDPEFDGLFDQMASYEVLSDMLFNQGRYEDVIDVYKGIRSGEIEGKMNLKNVDLLVVAACYKLNSPESLEYCAKLFMELNSVGHPRIATLTAALALEQNAPHLALEIVENVHKQNDVTVRSIRSLAYAKLGRANDVLAEFRRVLQKDRSTTEHTLTRDVISVAKVTVNDTADDKLIQNFNELEKALIKNGHVSSQTLDDLLLSEIDTKRGEFIADTGNGGHLMQIVKQATDPLRLLNNISNQVADFSAQQTLTVSKRLVQLKRHKGAATSSGSILQHPAFEILCQTLQRNSEQLQLDDAIAALRIFSNFGVSTNVSREARTAIFERIKSLINDATLEQTIFLSYLLPEPEVSSLQMMLPGIVQLRVSTAVDHLSVTKLIALLEYNSNYELTQECTIKIVNALSSYTHDIDPKQAKSILWSLTSPLLKVPMAHQDVLLANSIRVFVQNFDQFEWDAIENIFKKMITKHLFDTIEFEKFYDEKLFSKCADHVVRNDLGFERAISLYRQLNRVGFVDIRMLKYMVAKIEKNPKLITSCEPLLAFVSALSHANFKPDSWHNLRSLIVENDLLAKDISRSGHPWTKLSIELLSLGIECPSLWDQIFSNKFLRVNLRQNRAKRLQEISELYQLVKVLTDYDVERRIDVKYLIEAKDWLLATAQHPMQHFVETPFGGRSFVYTKVHTKHDQIIDHVIAYIAVMPFLRNYYCINQPTLRGRYELRLRAYEQMGINVVAINESTWNQLRYDEQIQYLKREVRLKLTQLRGQPKDTTERTSFREPLGKNSKPIPSEYDDIQQQGNDENVVWSLITAKVTNGNVIENEVFMSYFALCERKPDTFTENIDKMLTFIGDHRIVVSTEVIHDLLRVLSKFQYDCSITSVSKEGSCQCCRRYLRKVGVTADEFDKLHTHVCNSIFIKQSTSTQEELQSFVTFIDKTGPYDCVIDGLNVGLYNQTRKQKEQSSSLADVVKHFASQKKVLVIGRKHMYNWPEANMDYIRQNADIFLTDNSSEDDLFLLLLWYLKNNKSKKCVFISTFRNLPVNKKQDNFLQIYKMV